MDRKEYPHWLDGIVETLLERYEGVIHTSAGLSLRGMQHVGRIRGEILIDDVLKKELAKRGKEATHYLILYDRDPMPYKPLEILFEDRNKIENFVFTPLEDLPCPKNCCESWIDHFWIEFGGYLDEFGFSPDIKKTSEIYQTSAMKEIVKECIEKKEELRKIVNIYRGTKPYPEGWIPYNPICHNCGKLSNVNILSVDLKNWKASYSCNNCGDQGESSLSEGKLDWRIEWAALWKILHVDFEPYGKDHAAAGGSRESCAAIIKEFFDTEPPYGFPYEWVSMKMNGRDLGEMTASGFIGITPKEWLEMAEPEVLKYWYIKAKPMTHLALDLNKIDVLVDQFDRAERIYYNLEKPPLEDEKSEIIRSYEFAQVDKVPTEMPIRIPYIHSSMLAQILDINKNYDRILHLLKQSGHLEREPNEVDHKNIKTRLSRAKVWVERYAPERFKIKLMDELSSEIVNRLSDKQKQGLKELGKKLASKEYSQIEFHNEVYNVADELELKTSKLFEAAYLVLLGKKRGPRLGSFVTSLNNDFIIKRFNIQA